MISLGRSRRHSIPVEVGSLTIGGSAPLRVQTMCTVPLSNIPGCAAQAQRAVQAGAQLIRVALPSKGDVHALPKLRAELDALKLKHIPLVADVHFLPDVAEEALKWVEKVRINPGNFGRNLPEGEEMLRLSAFYREAKRLNRAVRVGVNHGSLPQRIRDQHGETAGGMARLAADYCRVAVEAGFTAIVVSMKSSSTRTMVQACRAFCEICEKEDLPPFPLHLGVTEAGLGEDGRLKSAVGIGALLADGIGDTLRVSLTEEPEAELPPALALARWAESLGTFAAPQNAPQLSFDPLSYRRRESQAISIENVLVGAKEPIRVVGQELNVPASIRHNADENLSSLQKLPGLQLISLTNPGTLSWTHAYRFLAAQLAHLGRKDPILLELPDISDPLIAAATLGPLLIDGIGDAIHLPNLNPKIAFSLLQAARARITKAEVISCPCCGRTSFPLAPLAQQVKDRFGHLTGLTLGVMGCVVNGPGEMQEADFGLVGAAPNRVDVYEARTRHTAGVPCEEALDLLEKLIRKSGKWKEA